MVARLDELEPRTETPSTSPMGGACLGIGSRTARSCLWSHTRCSDCSDGVLEQDVGGHASYGCHRRASSQSVVARWNGCSVVGLGDRSVSSSCGVASRATSPLIRRRGVSVRPPQRQWSSPGFAVSSSSRPVTMSSRRSTAQAIAPEHPRLAVEVLAGVQGAWWISGDGDRGLAVHIGARATT
jgi:hypothetical protein